MNLTSKQAIIANFDFFSATFTPVQILPASISPFKNAVAITYLDVNINCS
jgi:hypothetical protein